MSDSPSSTRPLLRSAALVGALTLFSRLTGLLRESVFAHFLGIGKAADAFRVAMMLPNLFRRLVGEGAVTSAFVPALSGHADLAGEEEGRIFAEKFLTLWVLILAVVTILGIVLSGAFIALAFGRGGFADPEKLDLTVHLSRILFPYLLLMGLFAAGHGVLTARGVFGPSAFAPIAHNLAFMAVALILAGGFAGVETAHAMAIAMLVAGLSQLVVILPALWRLGVRFRPRSPWDHAGVRDVVRRLIPGTLGAGVYQINVILSIALATRLDHGSVAALSYSNRLMEFVLGVFVVALSTVGLTFLSLAAGRQDWDGFRRTTGDLLRLVVFITVPSAVGLFLLRRPILLLIFGGGAFDAAALERTADAFLFHSLGLPWIGVNRVLVSCFHARKDLRTPVVVGMANMAVNVLLAWALSSGPLGHAGIACAATLAACVQTVCLLAAHLRVAELREGRGLAFQGLSAALVRTALATAVMGAACYAADLWVPQASGKALGTLRVLGLVGGGAGVFFLSARVAGMPELGMLLQGIAQKSRK